MVGTILCDSGNRYAAKLFNKEFLEMKGFLQHIPDKYWGALSPAPFSA